ncbi:polysaccharide biosynthesis/export family protein [Parafilimonas sp.]|uniref:polysaccharide biosynthesis/export family protein n=1 Tax=Parafilimonas sp. TaxID=1969739 RepID=UPI003F7FDE4C
MKRKSTGSNLFLFVAIISLISCTPTKNIPYFEDLSDTSKIYIQAIKETYDVVLQPDDLIGISVSSNNPDATAVFNMGGSLIQPPQNITGIPTQSPAANTTSNPVNSYLLDKQGMIDFPVLGKLSVKGLTVTQFKDSLKIKLDQYLQEPVVNIRLLNYKITVLGEVVRPATYSIPSERITVIDAIGMAGDLTIYGKRDNVLLIREEAGKRKFIHLNLNSSNIFESPYYYLKQNDIIYIEPGKAKVADLNANTLRTVTVVASVLSVLVLAIARLK